MRELCSTENETVNQERGNHGNQDTGIPRQKRDKRNKKDASWGKFPQNSRKQAQHNPVWSKRTRKLQERFLHEKHPTDRCLIFKCMQRRFTVLCNSFGKNYWLAHRKLSQNQPTNQDSTYILQGKPKVVQERVCKCNIQCGSWVYNIYIILNIDGTKNYKTTI